jgi:hypothetical protein
MTNILSPKGFQSYGNSDGVSSNFGLARGKMAYNASACYSGDPLIASGGKLAVATTTGASGAAVAGVAKSFSWLSTAQGRRVWQNYYPSNDSVGNADVDVFFVNYPDALFIVQSNGTTAVAQTDVGKFGNFATTNTGNTASGLSGMSLDYANLNATKGTLPFYIYKLVEAPATDPASAYNLVIVGFATGNLTQIG